MVANHYLTELLDYSCFSSGPIIKYFPYLNLQNGKLTNEYLRKLEDALEINPKGIAVRDDRVFHFARERKVL
ncbi:hypothetical protein O6P43_015913 [Quillaja saponaria]|uniref:Uncharacterized protein n=1 Tax=Quillaja saponaria TaxID=32244 RepID=A0AAD7LY16_QUISA|nr:hypothetical protein O6P43_015913 [Quillaja saponaria]